VSHLTVIHNDLRQMFGYCSFLFVVLKQISLKSLGNRFGFKRLLDVKCRAGELLWGACPNYLLISKNFFRVQMGIF